jgi:hypothetical protein
VPNKNKRKGDAAEVMATEYAKTKGFDARRTKAGYERDYGDVHLNPMTKKGAILQIKNVAQSGWAFTKWFEQLKGEAEESDAEIAVLVIKRFGMGEAKVGEWLALMRYEDMLDLIKKYQTLKEKHGD